MRLEDSKLTTLWGGDYYYISIVVYNYYYSLTQLLPWCVEWGNEISLHFFFPGEEKKNTTYSGNLEWGNGIISLLKLTFCVWNGA